MHQWDCPCDQCQEKRRGWANNQPPLIDELDDRDIEDHEDHDDYDPYQDEIDYQQSIDDSYWDRNAPIPYDDDFYDNFYRP